MMSDQMFTGIITTIGTIQKVIPDPKEGLRLTVSMPIRCKHVRIGASLAHNGVCLTVVQKGRRWLAYDVSPETLRCTTIGRWQAGQLLNIEPALKVGDELGGHLVLGHVDSTVRICSIEPVGTGYLVWCSLPPILARFIAPKGSVTLDGVALTVNEVDDRAERFSVMIIPHTWKHTIFSGYQAGDIINMEIDPVARYIARQIHS